MFLIFSRDSDDVSDLNLKELTRQEENLVLVDRASSRATMVCNNGE